MPGGTRCVNPAHLSGSQSQCLGLTYDHFLMEWALGTTSLCKSTIFILENFIFILGWKSCSVLLRKATLPLQHMLLGVRGDSPGPQWSVEVLQQWRGIGSLKTQVWPVSASNRTLLLPMAESWPPRQREAYCIQQEICSYFIYETHLSKHH